MMLDKIKDGMIFETIEYSYPHFTLGKIEYKLERFTYELFEKNNWRLPINHRVVSRLVVTNVK